MKNFQDLFVWKKSFELGKRIYLLSSKFPKYETYGLTAQIKRASISISSNIAEGCGRKTQKEFLQFLHNSFGSLKEVECQLMFARDFKYILIEEFDDIFNDCKMLSRMLGSLIVKIRKEIS